MDRQVVEQKLESLRRCLRRIEEKCPPEPELLAQDDNLARQLKNAVGFRNIAVHNYQEIDWHIVHAIARHHRDDFTQFATAIATDL